ncbi:hypothetical protein [Burkholderia sp. Ac-20379]|uniref:hypothetical protein n=1 Tax=Burkholderia sp. Ac-20379 TaxID=2703900 RepID=UPI00197DBF3E|nr:hypothetical protein [Burkholderia sp. Ac-20379]MBN3728043.1 hypothetical protein [Burkholderia sp. Ac-20379]
MTTHPKHKPSDNNGARRKGTGFVTREAGQPGGAAVPRKRNLKKPLLYLIGFGGLAAGAGLWLAPHDQGVDQDQVVEAERTRYASREACLQDWNSPEDCQYVSGDDTAQAMAAAPEFAASGAASAASAASAALAGNAHSGGGGAIGVANGSGAPASGDASREQAGGALDMGQDPVSVADTAAPHVTSTDAASGWYGPYFTRDGVVYHASGMHTSGVPFQHGIVSMLAMRESALSSAGSSAFRSTPHSVSISEGRAISRSGISRSGISRGGFLSSHGGSSRHGGGGWHGSGGG